jgi:hypothetical protein
VRFDIEVADIPFRKRETVRARRARSGACRFGALQRPERPTLSKPEASGKLGAEAALRIPGPTDGAEPVTLRIGGLKHCAW